MNRICPITYQALKGKQKYSFEGLKKLSRQLKTLHDLPLNAEQQRIEARRRAHKMSIQGVQAKLSAILNIKHGRFEIIDIGGKYILKPQSEFYPELPENEDLSMRLASSIGIEVPLHGLLYSIDGSLTYFIKRFDRIEHKQKLAVEDFAQLTNQTRDTKYNFSMERLIPIITEYCTFPILEKQKLFLRTIFNFLIGNEDMHLKNFSIISREEKIELSPAYDFLNTTIALGNAREELALPLNGKKNNLNKKDFINYFAVEKLALPQKIIDETLEKISGKLPEWIQLIQISFLSDQMKKNYLMLLEKRKKILF